MSELVQNGGESIPVSPPNKRIKVESIDRLSALPDCLLVRILAGLNMKEAVTNACVLSKRWQFLWTQLPRLAFKETSTKIEKTRRLVSWVHKALLLRTVNSLDGLDIEFQYDKSFASDVNTWVVFALRNEVKRLRLELLYTSPDFFDMLPQTIYSCSSLTKLSLRRCIVDPRVTVDWKALTKLTITEAKLNEDTIQKILLGCPVLSSLNLLYCWGFQRLEINSRCLEALWVSDCKSENTGPVLEISAPYIRSLGISLFTIGKKKLRLTNIPSVVAVNIHCMVSAITQVEMDDVVEFFENVKHVKSLILFFPIIAVVAKLAENGRQLPKCAREHLIVNSGRDEKTISSILFMLESSPNLKKLSINCSADSCYDDYEEFDWAWGRIVRKDLDCDLLHLKEVNLSSCADPNLDGEPMLTMARILLKRATALEKMVIDAEGREYETPVSFFELVQELLSYPRSSQLAVIDLKQ